MRIITWNCNGGFRNKFTEIDKLNADILFIQECEDPQYSSSLEYKNWSQNYIWYGDNKNKGIGFFAKPEITLKKLDWSNIYIDHEVKFFLPIQIDTSFTILGVWAHLNNSPTFGYIGQVWKYLQINKSNIENSIILGDFNSNKIWDKWDRWWNHSNVIDLLESLKIKSVYHHFNGQEQGFETRKTYYMHRNKEKGYHIDYFFSPKNSLSKIECLEIGNLQWLNLSDHLPIICDLNI